MVVFLLPWLGGTDLPANKVGVDSGVELGEEALFGLIAELPLLVPALSCSSLLFAWSLVLRNAPGVSWERST